MIPKKGEPGYEKHYRYMLDYRKQHYKHFNLLFDTRKERDMKLFNYMKTVPSNEKTEFIKLAIEEKLEREGK